MGAKHGGDDPSCVRWGCTLVLKKTRRGKLEGGDGESDDDVQPENIYWGRPRRRNGQEVQIISGAKNRNRFG